MDLVLTPEFLPATLTAQPMTDREFAAFCAEHPDLRFEMSAEGDLIVMAPTRSLSGARNARLLSRMDEWARMEGRGIVTDSSTGFVLPNGARRSPDCAWTLRTEIEKLSLESREGFWHLCPAFVVELKSPTDRLTMLRAKMREYLDNGAQLGWLIDPETRTLEVYRPDREQERLTGAPFAHGEGPVEGFALDLNEIWDPLALKH
jgi:Uma2 family endonuclease